MSKRVEVSKHFWPKWMMANATAWLAGVGVLGMLVGGIPLLFGVSFGAVLGMAQTIALKERVRWKRLLVANVLGWTVSVLIAEAVYQRRAYGSPAELIYLILVPTIGGTLSMALLFFLQWWQQSHRRVAWLFAFALCGAVGGVLGGQLMWIVYEAPTDGWALIVISGWIASGALFGLVTMIPIVWLQKTKGVASSG